MVTTSFQEARTTVHAIIAENKASLRRNFPNVVYKHVKALSTTLLPDNPSLIFSDDWAGWRDFLGPIYFDKTTYQRKDSQADNETPTIHLGVEEITKFDIEWNKLYIQLQEYYNEHGTLIVCIKQKTLQAWSSTQRSLKKRGMIRKDREKALNKIHFDWEPQQNNFDGYFALLQSFKDLYGHVDVPSRFKGNSRLGQWVREQRIFKRDSTLRKDRIRKLESIGFRWKIPEEERCLTLEQRNIT
jgi:hypothetical protein